MNKLYMLLGILLGILFASMLSSCVTQTVMVQGGGPCGPNCAPSRGRLVVEKHHQPLINVHVVPGGGCPPRGRMIRQPMIQRQQCPQPWYQQPWGHQQGGSTWGSPAWGQPGGYL